MLSISQICVQIIAKSLLVTMVNAILSHLIALFLSIQLSLDNNYRFEKTTH